MESLLTDLPPIDLALVGEPTGMQLAVAEKGLMVIDATAHGKIWTYGPATRASTPSTRPLPMWSGYARIPCLCSLTCWAP